MSASTGTAASPPPCSTATRGAQHDLGRGGHTRGSSLLITNLGGGLTYGAAPCLLHTSQNPSPRDDGPHMLLSGSPEC